jgi:serine/threonine-protein kinase
VLLSWEGAVKVADFGIAKARAASNASASILIKGKPAYMSPEQVNGHPLDGRSDLFAVGVMLFEMLCGQHLFAGGTAQETLGHVLYKDIPKIRALRPEVPDDLAAVVAGLLVRDREHRTPSAAAAIEGLAACADHPRTGREELIATLASRFPTRAPRHACDIVLISHSDPTLIARPLGTAQRVRLLRTATAHVDAGRSGARPWRWAIVAGLLATAAAAGILLAREKPPAREAGTPGDHGPAPGSVTAPAAAPAPNLTATPSTPAAASPAAAPPPATAGRGAQAEPSAKQTSSPVPGHPPSSTPARRAPAGAASGSGIREIHL